MLVTMTTHLPSAQLEGPGGRRLLEDVARPLPDLAGEVVLGDQRLQHPEDRLEQGQVHLLAGGSSWAFRWYRAITPPWLRRVPVM